MLSDILSGLKRHWLLALIALLMPSAFAIMICVAAKPSYEATSLLLLADARLSNSASAEPSEASPQRREQLINSQVYIIESETVVRQALQHFGVERFLSRIPASQEQSQSPCSFFDIACHLSSLGGGKTDSVPEVVREASTKKPIKADEYQPMEDKAYLIAKGALKVQAERGTDLIRVSFRYGDAAEAAEFTNDIVNAFVDRSVELYGNKGVASFFDGERDRYEAQAREAQAALDSYARKNKIYSISEQRKLALTSRSALLQDLAATHGIIADKEVTSKSLARQLLEFKPLSYNPSLQQLAHSASGANQPLTTQPYVQAPSDPPLLLVRVYQDTVQSLVRTNSEVEGAKALAAQQSIELARTEHDLDNLSTLEADFDQLQRKLAEAHRNLEIYSKRSTEERLEADFRQKKFFSLRPAQAALPPLGPVFPRPQLIIPGGVGISLVLCVCVGLMGRKSDA